MPAMLSIYESHLDRYNHVDQLTNIVIDIKINEELVPNGLSGVGESPFHFHVCVVTYISQFSSSLLNRKVR